MYIFRYIYMYGLIFFNYVFLFFEFFSYSFLYLGLEKYLYLKIVDVWKLNDYFISSGYFLNIV